MSQIDVWSKGEKKHKKGIFEALQLLIITLYFLQSVKYVSKSKQLLTLKILFGA